MRREAVHRQPRHPPRVSLMQEHHVAVELVAPALLQLRRHVALELGAGTAAGASAPTRSIERPAANRPLERVMTVKYGSAYGPYMGPYMGRCSTSGRGS